jgi:thymidylate synthase (FAD)
MHQDYAEGFAADDPCPSEQQAGAIAVKRLLSGERGHYGPLEHAQIVLNAGWFPHSVMQQARTHRVGVSFDCQCLAGDTQLTVLRKDGKICHRLSLEQLYQRWQNDPAAVKRLRIRSLDEERNAYTTNHIDAVICSGVKPTFLVKLADGKSIRCTKEHRILSVNGWQTLGELSVGDRVMVNGQPTADAPVTYQNKAWLEERFSRGLIPRELAMEAGVSTEAIKKWAYHHGLSWTHRVWNKGTRYNINISQEERERRQWHARVNLGRVERPKGADHPSWKTALSPEKRAYNWLKYARPGLIERAGNRCQDCNAQSSRLHCHHILPVDVRPELGCDETNIRVLCPACHKRTHALSAHPMQIVSITPAGECATYDIAMQAPHHNFVANGIVVHNSMRYTSQRIIDVATRDRDIEEVFYLRPEGTYTDRQGARYEYTRSMRLMDLSRCYDAAAHYAHQLRQGMAEEHARGMLPFDYRQHFVVSFTLRALLHFLDLRSKADAQLEIRQLCDLIWPHLQAWAPEIACWYEKTRLGKARLAP